ncbi:MAG: hypothetical protein ACYC67_18420 [Prosthecobacter sp.]
MKASSWLCLLIVGVFPCLAHARLGDTERRCVERYGSALPNKKQLIAKPDLIPGLPHATYHYQGWNIRVVFAGGLVVAEEYQKKLPHPSGQSIKTDERTAVLEAESAGNTWNQTLTHPLQSSLPSSIIANALMGGQHWMRSDGAYATLTPMALNLVLYSKEGLEAARQAAAAKEQKRKDSVPKF